MPITKSAKKALRQSERKRALNLKRRKAVSDIVRKIKNLISSGKQDEALALLPQAYKAFDKAAKRNVLLKNTASRKKSRLLKSIRKSGGGQ